MCVTIKSKEGESLDKLKSKGEGKNIGYVPFLFIANPPF